MPITFNSQGGFLNGTISSSNGDIFITTSGSVGAINVGQQLQLTGSQIIEKDTSGNVRNKKTFNTDGSITHERFDGTGKTIDTRIKDPSSGKEFIRSGSATSNQIEFKQDTTSAEITLSGSGTNKLTFLGSSDDTTQPGFFQRQDTPKGTVYSQNLSVAKVVSTGINPAGDYFISPANIAPINTANFDPVLKVTQTGNVSMSGDLVVTGDISANSLNVTHFTSSFVTSSTITTEGNTIFGDTDSDSHTFNGHITASGNISASGEYLGNQIQIYQANFSDDIGTTTHFIPLGTSTFEQTTEDDDAVGLVAPYDGELVKIIYRHNFDASSTSTRWLMSIIADGTDMAGTATTRFRGSVTGASTDTIKEITVADADTEGLSNMTFSKGESVFISLRNSADVTTNTINDEFHVTVVLKFNVPLGLI